jgi:YesN/AraC family two-component response regulator
MRLREKYATSSLAAEQEARLYQELLMLMERDKMYLNPDLQLKDLAVRLRTNTRYLSQVVNHRTHHNLLHFINTYRVAEVQAHINHPDYRHLSTFGVAQHCGFKNKSTFYKVFREITGVTPREYQVQGQRGALSPVSDGVYSESST